MTLSEFVARLSAEPDNDGWVARCPAHADSHPSLRISVGATGATLLKCRAGCATDAVLAALDMNWRGLAAIDTADAPVRARSTATPAGPAAVAALAARLDRYATALHDGHSQGARDAWEYAKARFGLGAELAATIGLGYADDLGGGGRLVVPFRDPAGTPRGYQARALDPGARVRWLGARSPEGESWAKIGWLPGESGWAEVIVAEGPGDGLTACATGYDAIIVRGAALAGGVVDEVAAWAAGRPVVICGDADPSGDEFARTLAAGLAKLGTPVRKVRPPRDGDDLTDWRRRDPAGFAQDFIRAVCAAQPLSGTTARVDGWTDADLTEVASARRLRAHFELAGSGVRYSPEAGFFILQSGVWRPDRLDAVRTAAQEVAATIWTEAAELADQLDAIEAAGDPAGEAKRLRPRVGKLRSFARAANSSKGIDAMVRELRALSGVATDLADFDRHHHLVACRNGVIDLRTGALLPHDPALLLTRRVNHDYDPAATCPRWERFLSEVFPDARAHAGLPAYMRRLVGYGITGETGEQCFAVLWGTGANGKSVLSDTLTEVFRELTVTTPFATFEEKPSGGIPNDLAALKGARLVFAAEGEQGRPMAEAVLKRVTGRDSISARFMRREFFEFRPTFLLMLATNFRPNFRGQDEGLWRRVKLVPFQRYFTPAERDHKLGAKLLTEAPGILAWAVRGAVEWYAAGLADPASIVTATADYRQTSNALDGFLPGVYVLDPDSVGVLGDRVFGDFQAWADEGNFVDLKRWSRRAFYAALEERGIAKRRGTGNKTMLDGVRRARQTDAAREENLAEPRTPGGLLAHSTNDTPPPSGPSLDDIL